MEFYLAIQRNKVLMSLQNVTVNEINQTEQE